MAPATELQDKLILILEIHAKYEQIMLQQAETMNRLMGTVDRLAGHTERMLDLIELMSGRMDRSDERTARLEKILDRLVENSGRHAGELRSVIESQKQAAERVQNLVSAMGQFIGMHSPRP